MRRSDAARERIVRACAAPGDERGLRERALAEIREVVPFDFHAWVLTDPETCVGTAPLATIPALDALPTLIRLKYLTPVLRWTTLAGVAALADGDPARSLLWRELLAGYGVRDVACVVFADRFGCWAFLDLWRTGGTFTAAELRFLDSLRPALTTGIRSALLGTFTPAGPVPAGPAVLLLDGDLAPRTGTPGSDTHLRALLPTPPDRSPVPAAALNAAAQLLAVEAGIDAHPPHARLPLASGAWVGVRAARLDAGSTGSGDPAIAVTIERAGPADRRAVFGRVAGLSHRERELLDVLAAGADSRGAARALGIAEGTVHDHLKSVFAKTGARGRHELLARVAG